VTSIVHAFIIFRLYYIGVMESGTKPLLSPTHQLNGDLLKSCDTIYWVSCYQE